MIVCESGGHANGLTYFIFRFLRHPQKAKADARKKAVEAKAKRGQDTRRKVLAGALVLDMMERDEATRQRFTERLDKYLTRADDRALRK